MKKNLLLTLFLLLVVATSFAQRQFRFKDGKFKVVQFTDIHWDPKSPGCDTTRNTILSVLKQEKPDIAILTGDVVTDNPARKGWEAIVKIFEDAKMPFAVTMGNHDAGSTSPFFTVSPSATWIPVICWVSLSITVWIFSELTRYLPRPDNSCSAAPPRC